MGQGKQRLNRFCDHPAQQDISQLEVRQDKSKKENSRQQKQWKKQIKMQ